MTRSPEEHAPSIRLLLPADAPAYVVLRRAMLLDAPSAFSSEPGHDRGSDPAGVATSLSGEGFAIVGGFSGNRLVAAAGLNREASSKRCHIVWIWGVYVAPEVRGQGFGRAVMQTAIAHARTWPGVAALQLGVNERSLAARRLYDALGFVPWGVEPDAIRVDGVSTAETHMRLSW